jgi:hypothetical protein
MNNYGFHCFIKFILIFCFLNILFTSAIEKRFGKNELYVNWYAMINKMYIKLLHKMLTICYGDSPTSLKHSL